MNTHLPVGSRIIGLDLSKKSCTGCVLAGVSVKKSQRWDFTTLTAKDGF